MGFSNLATLKLKEGAVPTKAGETEEETTTFVEEARTSVEETKTFVEVTPKFPEERTTVKTSTNQDSLQIYIKKLEDKMDALRKENDMLKMQKNQAEIRMFLRFFFGIIRSKGGLHDHPDRQEFKYRLRSYILGYNEFILGSNANVEIDNTPDLEDVHYSLTGKILKRY